MNLTVDLNADLGEDCGDDDAMLAVLSSANISCGYHAGSLATLLTTLEAAVEAGVRIGAHPSYPDRENFGRTSMAHTVGTQAFTTALDAQLDSFAAVSRRVFAATDSAWSWAETSIAYIKAHGALYNDAARDPQVARALVMAAQARSCALMHQPDTLVQRYAQERGVVFIAEVFADRAYQADGTLVPRSQPGAVLHEPEEIAERVVRMVTQRTVIAVDGSVVSLPQVDSVCVHGDTPGALAIARTVHAALMDAGVQIASRPTHKIGA